MNSKTYIVCMWILQYNYNMLHIDQFQNLLPLPDGAGTALVKPTKYHYYPHNQHIYLLPECAIQQVSNSKIIYSNIYECKVYEKSMKHLGALSIYQWIISQF